MTEVDGDHLRTGRESAARAQLAHRRTERLEVEVSGAVGEVLAEGLLEQHQVELLPWSSPGPREQRHRTGVIGMRVRDQQVPYTGQRRTVPRSCTRSVGPTVQHQPVVDQRGSVAADVASRESLHARGALT